MGVHPSIDRQGHVSINFTYIFSDLSTSGQSKDPVEGVVFASLASQSVFLCLRCPCLDENRSWPLAHPPLVTSHRMLDGPCETTSQNGTWDGVERFDHESWGQSLGASHPHRPYTLPIDTIVCVYMILPQVTAGLGRGPHIHITNMSHSDDHRSAQNIIQNHFTILSYLFKNFKEQIG